MLHIGYQLLILEAKMATDVTVLNNVLHQARSKLSRQQQAVKQTIELIKTLEEEIQRIVATGSQKPATK